MTTQSVSTTTRQLAVGHREIATNGKERQHETPVACHGPRWRMTGESEYNKKRKVREMNVLGITQGPRRVAATLATVGILGLFVVPHQPAAHAASAHSCGNFVTVRQGSVGWFGTYGSWSLQVQVCSTSEWAVLNVQQTAYTWAEAPLSGDARASIRTAGTSDVSTSRGGTVSFSSPTILVRDHQVWADGLIDGQSFSTDYHG